MVKFYLYTISWGINDEKKLVLLALLVFSIYLFGCTTTKTSQNNIETVSIVKKESHYEVILDFNNGVSHREIGEEYGKKILEILPNYEALIDSYISDFFDNYYNYNIKSTGY